MNDAEFRSQPKSVREEFEKISDSFVDKDKLIVQWKEELESALENASLSAKKHDQVRAILGSLQGEIDKAKLEIEGYNERRAAVIAGCLINGGDYAQDDELLAYRSDAELRVERLTIARPALERNRKVEERAVGIDRNPCVRLEDRINNRRDLLKLNEARRRHGLG